MKAFIKQKLKEKVKALLAEHQPIIVAVTGSVGKTSTRNAIATVLSAKYTVGTTIKNYNNEFGVPLSILGETSPGKSALGWMRILLTQPKNVPEVFVLEYGVDRPGDMDYLCDIAAPDVAVLTRISPVHAEHFATVQALAEEKSKLLTRVRADGLSVVNADDKMVMGVSKHSTAPLLSYGFSDVADVRAQEPSMWTRQDYSFEPSELFSTLSFHVSMPEHDGFDVELKNMLGNASGSSALAAITVAQHLGLSHEEILSKISDIPKEPGRMNPIPGIKGSLIIDSSYNAAPASMAEALDVLQHFHPTEDGRRIAVLGHMAELGQYAEEEHRMLGMRVAEAGVDVLITVGELTRDTRRGAIEAGIPEEQTEHFHDSYEAGRWMDANIKKGDIVLVKGSRSATMEKVVKDVMAEPMRAEELIIT